MRRRATPPAAPGRATRPPGPRTWSARKSILPLAAGGEPTLGSPPALRLTLPDSVPRSGTRDRAAGRRLVRVAQRPLARHVLPVGARHGIDEIVEAPARAGGLEQRVAGAREQHAVPRKPAEEVRLQLGVLARLRDVDRDPAGARGVELRPAVVALHLLRSAGRAVAVGEREAHVPARRDAARARERDEQGMEVGAVPLAHFEAARSPEGARCTTVAGAVPSSRSASTA